MRRTILGSLTVATVATVAGPAAVASANTPPPPVVVYLDGTSCDPYYGLTIYIANTLHICVYNG